VIFLIQLSIGQRASCSKTFTETDVIMYAGISGDFNPIHIDKEYAKKSLFKERIAHGLLTSSLLSQLLGMHLPGKGSVYMNQTIRFTLPVFIGDTITATGVIEEIDEKRKTVTLFTECHNQHNKIVLTGKAMMLVPGGVTSERENRN